MTTFYRRQRCESLRERIERWSDMDWLDRAATADQIIGYALVVALIAALTLGFLT